MDLQEIRKEIDRVDGELLELFEKRMELCSQVAESKIETGKPVFDRTREQEKLERLKRQAATPFTEMAAEELFSQIMSISRKLQYQILTEKGKEETPEYEMLQSLPMERAKVVFQGVEGAYSFAAMKRFFGKDVPSFHVRSWKDAMEAIAWGDADYAVLPIENSTAGIVADIYDLLVEYHHYIVGEQIVRAEHVLMGLPGTELSGIRTVYSHPQGLWQCRKFLEQHPDWETVDFDNTATAARKVAQDQDKTQAAIASREAAEHYGLSVLQEGITSCQSNATRFIIVSKKKLFLENAGKISICFEIPHESGSLYNILSHMIYNNLNMTKIESRPIPERNWEYRFFVDFEGNLNDSGVKNALRGIEQETKRLRIFGNY